MRVLWCAVLLSLIVAVPDAAHAAGRRSFDFDAGLGGLRVAARRGATPESQRVVVEATLRSF